MNKIDEVSVILCSYQGERFIAQQIESILSQSYPFVSIHVFDDASEDKTVAIVKEYQQKNSNLHLYINEHNIGYINNFEQALKQSKAKYIALCDQDDIWHPDKLLLSMKEMAKLENEQPQTAILVHSDLSLIDTLSKPLHPSFFAKKSLVFPNKKSLSHILGYCGVMGNTIVMNRVLLELALPFPKELKYHDYWFALVNEFFGIRKTINKPLVQYRIHQKNTSNNKNIGIKKLSFSRWFKLDFLLPFKEDARDKTIRQFIERYTLDNTDKALLEGYLEYLIFDGHRFKHFIFLLKYNFLHSGFLSRAGVFIRMMITMRYHDAPSQTDRKSL